MTGPLHTFCLMTKETLIPTTRNEGPRPPQDGVNVLKSTPQAGLSGDRQGTSRWRDYFLGEIGPLPD